MALKVQILNEIQLISTRKFAIDETSTESESSTEEETSSESESSIEEETSTDLLLSSEEETFSSFEVESSLEIQLSNSEEIEYTSETNTQTIDLPNPTQTFSFIEPTINDSFTSDSTFIKFVENGFDNGSFISIEDTNSDVLLIKSNSNHITLQTNETAQLNDFLFVSLQVINTIFKISSPQEGREDYGTGQFGIHANSKNPTVELPKLGVPLNIFKDEESVTKFEYIEQSRRNLNLLDTNHQISLKKLTISKGTLNLDLPHETSEVHFNYVETFLNRNLVARSQKSIIETSIESLVLNSRSVFKISEAQFNISIIANDNSKLIEENAKIS